MISSVRSCFARWLKATDPGPMLEHLRGKASDRKLRLFAVACCRQIWDHLDETCRNAVEVAERYADGLASTDALKVAFDAVFLLVAGESDMMGADAALNAVSMGPWFDFPKETVCRTVEAAACAAHVAAGTRPRDLGRYIRGVRATFNRFRAAQAPQAALLRCLAGPLHFRPLVPIGPSVLRWNDGLVVRLAKAAYEERLLPSGHLDPQRLAVLADAAEEAGAEAQMVEHLQGPGPHCRGCFILDAILKRE